MTTPRVRALALLILTGVGSWSCGGGESKPAPAPTPTAPAATSVPEATTPASAATPPPPAATLAPATKATATPSPSGAPPTTIPATVPTLAPTPVATPVVDAARVAALVSEGDGAMAQAKWTDAAKLFDEALSLDPGNPHARAARARAMTAALGLTRTFVPDVASAQGAEGSVKEIDDFEVEDLDVKRAVHIPGRTELEGTPARMTPGDTYTVKIYVRNQSKKKKRIIKITELNVHRIVNGADLSVPLSPTVREVPAKTRVLVATLTGPWEDDVSSWSLQVRVMTEGNDMYENRLVWK